MEYNREGSSRCPPGIPYPVIVGMAPELAFSLDDNNDDHGCPIQVFFSSLPEVLSRDNRASEITRPLNPPVSSRSSQSACHQRNCNHSTVTRQYSIDEYETCDSCGRRPLLGWFYLCTEDSSGHSEPVDPGGSLLAPWIVDAIIARRYTAEEKEVLIRQKLEVLQLCERGMSPLTPAGSMVELDKEANTAQNVAQLPLLRASCSYRACHHCDRKLNERTWLSINEVCNNPDTRPPTAWDLRDRRVSDARVVCNLGLRSPPVPPHVRIFRADTLHRYPARHSWKGSISRSRFNLPSLLGTLSTIDEANEDIDIELGEICDCLIEDLVNELTTLDISPSHNASSSSIEEETGE